MKVRRFLGGAKPPFNFRLQCKINFVMALIDASDDAAKGVVARLSCGQTNLRGVVGLPGRDLAAEVVVAIAGRKPRDVSHVKGNEARGGYHAPFCVVIPSSIGLNPVEIPGKLEFAALS